MFDDDDFEFVLLGAPGGVVGVIFIVFAFLVLHLNESDCSAMHCATGHPALVAHECLCVTPAAP